MPELQVVPARHGVATFVPAGQSIKIVNTSGSQVVDTWAFALPTKPDAAAGGEEQKQKQDDEQQQQQQQKDAPKKNEQPQQQQQQQKEEENPAARPTPKKSRKSGVDLPTQEEAEKATREGIEKGDGQQGQQQTQQKNTWSSYMPSIGWSGKNGNQQQGEQSQQSQQKGETEKQKNSRTWASYMPSGKAYSSYIPKGASDTVASFASTHARDPNKSYVQQLKDFSQTPVGAAGIKAFSGSGYSGSLYAGYQAWNAMNAPDAAGMEFLSMQHTRSSTLHLIPKVDDVLVSNLREPMLTLVEDTSSGGCHDTLMAACDPPRYKQLGVEHWEEHGSCAENLVLALKELNERAGLKGANAVGAEVTINNVPAPLNLFMNVPWQESGDIDFKSPRTKAGDYVRLRADRDVVVVMSSCPQDVTDINGGKITDAHFLVEGGEGDDNSAEEKRKPIPRRRPAPRKINSSKTVATGEMGDDDKSQVGSTPAKKKPLARKTPVKKTAQSQAGGATPAAAARKPAGASTAQTATKKKTVPKPAGTPARAGEGQGNAAQNGTSTPSDGKPVEKKKPRKLVRSTPAPAQNGGGE